MNYVAASQRYQEMPYRLCGKSGLKLPALSLGLWHNFGDTSPLEEQRQIVRAAFDRGIAAFRLGQQLRPPLRQRRAEFRPHLARRPRKPTATN